METELVHFTCTQKFPAVFAELNLYCTLAIVCTVRFANNIITTKQEAFEKCWAHSPLRAAARPFTRCRYCRTPAIAIAQAACDVHDDDDNNDNDNAWQRGPLWPHRMGPITAGCYSRSLLSISIISIRLAGVVDGRSGTRRVKNGFVASRTPTTAMLTVRYSQFTPPVATQLGIVELNVSGGDVYTFLQIKRGSVGTVQRLVDDVFHLLSFFFSVFEVM